MWFLRRYLFRPKFCIYLAVCIVALSAHVSYAQCIHGKLGHTCQICASNSGRGNAGSNSLQQNVDTIQQNHQNNQRIILEAGDKANQGIRDWRAEQERRRQERAALELEGFNSHTNQLNPPPLESNQSSTVNSSADVLNRIFESAREQTKSAEYENLVSLAQNLLGVPITSNSGTSRTWTDAQGNVYLREAGGPNNTQMVALINALSQGGFFNGAPPPSPTTTGGGGLPWSMPSASSFWTDASGNRYLVESSGAGSGPPAKDPLIIPRPRDYIPIDVSRSRYDREMQVITRGQGTRSMDYISYTDWQIREYYQVYDPRDRDIINLLKENSRREKIRMGRIDPNAPRAEDDPLYQMSLSEIIDRDLERSAVKMAEEFKKTFGQPDLGERLQRAREKRLEQELNFPPSRDESISSVNSILEGLTGGEP
jgi:hypothetical protein